MKRFACLVLLLCLLPLAVPAEETPVYTARTAKVTTIYPAVDTEEGIGRVPKGKRIDVYAVDPAWVIAEYDGVRGYVRRSCLESVRPVDTVNTPPYGVEVFSYIAKVASDAPVTSQLGGGTTLVTLYPGAQIAFIGFEQGYAKLIYHRQYAYIDSNCLSDILPVDRNLSAPGAGAPIAAYVSFYNLAETEANIGRMENIRVACEKLCALRFATGESLNFNTQIGPYNAANGYHQAPVLVDGTTKLNYGGGTCQVSSTLYNVVLQLPGATVLQRRPHGPSGASYLPHGVDAAVGRESLNFRFRNEYAYPIRIDASCKDGALYIAIYRAE